MHVHAMMDHSMFLPFAIPQPLDQGIGATFPALGNTPVGSLDDSMESWTRINP